MTTDGKQGCPPIPGRTDGRNCLDDCFHANILYTQTDDLSRTFLSPMTGVAIDGSLTLMGMEISHLPLLVRRAIAKLWIYEHKTEE